MADTTRLMDHGHFKGFNSLWRIYASKNHVIISIVNGLSSIRRQALSKEMLTYHHRDLTEW